MRIDPNQGPNPVLGESKIVILIRAIGMLLFLTVALFATEGSAHACASAPMALSQQSGDLRGVILTHAADHWESTGSATQHSPRHGGACADHNCGFCCNAATVASAAAFLPILSVHEPARTTTIAALVGRDIAPETGPPKRLA